VTITRTWQIRRLLARAWQALLVLDVPEAELLAARLERVQTATGATADATDYTTAALRAALLAVQDDPMAALALARRAQQPYADAQCRALAAMICRWAHWQAGELNEFHGAGRAQWRVGSRRCRAITAIFDLNLEAAVEFGRLRLAVSRTLAAEALERARWTACSESAAGLLAAAFVAQVAYEQGQLEEAELAIRYRMSVVRTAATIECVTCAYIVLARLAVQRRRSDSALTLLRDAQAIGERRRWPRLVAAMLGERIRILLDDHEEAGALSSLRDLEALLKSQPTASASARADMEIHCQLAQLRFRQRHVAAAQTAAAVESLRQKALARCDLRLALEMHLISVAAYAQCGDISEANERLIDALDVGAANGLCMTFVDAGPVVRKLLEELCHDSCVSDERVLELRPYMHTLLARFPGSQQPANSTLRPPAAIQQPLTPRESNVLRLIAGGLSNKRIAQRLDIAPETVKSHTKSIFAKLAAQTRAQAVAHGEALGLIQGGRNAHGALTGFT
jgi:ATP/maltotriose-dependent transcriptional regulator MalT